MYSNPHSSSFTWIHWLTILSLACFLLTLATTIVLALIPIYLRSAGEDLDLSYINSRSTDYILNYKTDLQTGNNAYQISNLNTLSNSLNQKYDLPTNSIQGQTARFTTDYTKRRKRRNIQCEGDTNNLNGDILTTQIQVKYRSSCGNVQTCTNRFLTNFVSKVKSVRSPFSVSLSFTNGQTQTVTLASCSLTEIDSIDGTWTLSNQMLSARTNFPAVKLNDGRILVSGGYNEISGILSSSEIYTPSTSTWTSTGSMNQNREYHAMTLLANGNQVLVTGGETPNSITNTSELYNINTGIWTLISNNMPEQRALHSSTLFNNGRVLIAGGIIDDTKTAVYYDSSSSTWTDTGSMIASYRESPTAILLTDGRVLVTGGATASKLARDSAETYDPTANTWQKTSGSMISARYYHTAVRLSDGTVLIVGGLNASNVPTSTAELYNPSSDSFSSIAGPIYGGTQMTLTVLSNGYVLSTPGGDLKTNCPVLSEIYNPSTKKWLKTGFLNIGRESNFAFLISNRVFTCGGDNINGTLAKCEFFSLT